MEFDFHNYFELDRHILFYKNFASRGRVNRIVNLELGTLNSVMRISYPSSLPNVSGSTLPEIMHEVPFELFLHQ